MISIIVPVYKVEKYLRRCIDSILLQTYKDFELILVDDGSPDRCGEICDEYALKEGRIRVIHQENGGLSAARNAGLEVAQGEYIGFADSDDYCHPEMFDVLHNNIAQYNADLVVSKFERIEDSSEIVSCKSHTSSKEEIIDGNEALKRFIVEKDFGAYVWNKLFRKSLFKETRFPVGKLYEDDFIMPSIFYRCKRIVVIPQVLYYYVINPKSLTCTEKSIRHFDLVESRYQRIRFLESIDFPKQFIEHSARSTIYSYWNLYNDIEPKSRIEKKRIKDIKKMVRYCYRIQGNEMRFTERLVFETPQVFCLIKSIKHLLLRQ